MENQFEGGLNKVAGFVQEAVGDVAADSGLQANGKLRQVAGQVRQTYGSAIDSVRSQAISNPLVAIAVAAGVGFILGTYWTKRD